MPSQDHDTNGSSALLEKLTPREQETLAMIASGATNSEIADSMVISVHTVKEHLKRIYGKLDVRNRTSAVARARLLGLLDTAATPVRVHNLPHLKTPLFGRDDELAALAGWLSDDQTRLITVRGPGGIGKTHLAIEAARANLDHFPDGVFLTQLAAIQSAEQLEKAILASIDESFAGDASTGTLAEILHDKSVLVVLDNMETAVEAARKKVLEALLYATPNVKILATSREALGLRGEVVLSLEGLRVADAGDGISSATRSADNSAIELFLYNARRHDPSFLPAPADLDVIHAICQHINGMPLGILLASSWLHVLPLDEIAARFAVDVDELDHTLADPLLRRQTLAQAFQQSWLLLSPETQAVLMGLSLFAGDISLAGAEAVAEATPATLRELVNRSLLEWSSSQQRYRLHPFIRHYAGLQLADHGLQQAYADRLLAFVVSMVGYQVGVKNYTETIHAKAWLLELHYDDISAAIQYAAGHGQLAVALLLWIGITYLWREYGYNDELYHHYTTLSAHLETSPTVDPALAAHFLEHASQTFFNTLPHHVVIALLETAVTRYGDQLEPRGRLKLSITLAYLQIEMGHFAAAEQQAHANLAMARAIGDTHLLIEVYRGLVLCATHQAQYEVARQHNLAALAHVRAATDINETSRVLREQQLLLSLGVIELELGAYDAAEAKFRAVLAYAETRNNLVGQASCLANLGEIHYLRGQLDEALALHVRGLAMGVSANVPNVIMHELEHLGYVLAALRRPEEAVRLLAMAEAMRDQHGAPLSPQDRGKHERHVAALRDQLSALAFDMAWHGGRLSDRATEIEALLTRYQCFIS